MQFEFLTTIKNHVDLIADEYKRAKENVDELKYFFKDDEMPIVYSHFEYWIKESGFDPTQIGYDARGEKPVGGFPIFKKNFPIKWIDAHLHFKETMKLLSFIPNIHFAQFSIMSPGAFILTHKHAASSFIFHLNLFDLNGRGIFEVEGDVYEYSRKGDCFLFDPSDNHSSKNESSDFRVTLMFEFYKMT
jgi:aspartyl/asparaginyl beta-hydroxylase (cupin superfamily)